MTTRTAWFCPSCQRYHAPHCDSCPSSMQFGTPGVVPVPLLQPWPYQPSRTGDPLQPPWVTTYGGIGISAACVGQANNAVN